VKPTPSTTTNPNVPVSCGGELFAATPVQANFLIVLDHSGSMREQVGGQSKWAAATTAVRSITKQNETKIRFGLNMFSFASPQCDPGRNIVAIGDKMADEISAALPADSDGNRTPIGGALNVALGNPGLVDANRSNNVLLITDGKENCGGNPVGQATSLFNKGIKTYVIGFGGEIDQKVLSNTALQGGTSRNGPIKYYQADSPTELQTALDAITRAGLGCDLKLAKAPADPSKLFVYVNGSEQPRDTTRKNGWDYAADGQRITLYGASCGLVSADANVKVSVVYGCPDGSLVERAPGSSCGANEHCASGKCTAGFCEAPSNQKPGGASCGANAECASNVCTNGRCENPAGVGKPGGAACSGNAECQSGTCASGLCEAPASSKPDGAACTTNTQCASTHCVSGVCAGADKLPDGSGCSSAEQCASSNCTAGTCQPGGKPGGSACGGGGECASGVCTGGVCEGGRPVGASCTGDAQCETGSCVSNQCAPILG
jgi:hypothetical protein